MKLHISLSAGISKKMNPSRAVKKAALKVKSTYNEREWWKKLTPKEQADYLQEHPNSSIAERHNGIVRNVLHKGISTVVDKVKENRLEYKEGFDGLKNFKHGRELSDTQKDGVKKIAKTAAIILLGGLAASLLFTPAGGAAVRLAEDFFDHFMKDRSSDEAVANNDSDMEDFVKQMGKWLQTQDLSKYAKNKKPKSK